MTQTVLYGFDEIDALIPHSGDMCLWDSVLAFDEQNIQCRTARHLDEHHPLKEDGVLSKIHLIEFGAQSIAIHGGLQAKQQDAPKLGYLASVKNVEFGEFDQTTPFLFVQATQLMADDQSKLYQFEVTDQQQRPLCSGRALVIHPQE